MKDFLRFIVSRILLLSFSMSLLACPGPEEQVYRDETFGSRHDGIGEHKDYEGIGKQDRLDADPSQKGDVKKHAKIRHENVQPNATSDQKRRFRCRPTVTIFRHERCRLAADDFYTAVRRTFDHVDPNWRTVALSSMLVPVVTASLRDDRGFSPSGDEQETPQGLSFFMSDVFAGFAEKSATCANSFIWSPAGDENVVPLIFGRHLDNTVIFLDIDIRPCNIREDEATPLVDVKSQLIENTELSFTEESCRLIQLEIESKIRDVCRSIFHRLDLLNPNSSDSIILGQEFFGESQEHLNTLRNQTDIIPAFWSAMGDAWMQRLAQFDADQYRSEIDEPDGIKRAKYFLQSTLLERDLIRLHRVYQEVEVFLSFSNSVTLTRYPNRR